jgi:hypothetical protein
LTPTATITASGDAAVAARLYIGRIEPDVGPIAFVRGVEKGGDLVVDLAAQPADLALRHAGHAHGLDQLVDRAGRDALHVGFLDDRSQRLLGQPSRLQEDREVAALAQLGDAQFDRAGAGFPDPVAVAVTLGDPLGAALAMGAPVKLSTSSAISRSAAKPIISRSSSASELFSSSVRRLIVASVITGPRFG